MSTKKVPAVYRLWVEDNGSIYTADTEDVITEFSRKTIKVRTSIAFNVGAEVARHIVELHNANINWINGIR